MPQETLRARFRRRYKASAALRAVTWLLLLTCLVLFVAVLWMAKSYRGDGRRRELATLCPNDAASPFGPAFLLPLPGARCIPSLNLVQVRMPLSVPLFVIPSMQQKCAFYTHQLVPKDPPRTHTTHPHRERHTHRRHHDRRHHHQVTNLPRVSFLHADVSQRRTNTLFPTHTPRGV